jgi:hypothetical protein
MTTEATEQDIEKACRAKIDHLTYKHVVMHGSIIGTVAKVRKGPNDKRRIRIDFEPNERCLDPDDKPLHYLPCKGMIRVLREAWGKNGSVDWVGKSMELFGNPDVMYAGKKEGGIQISRLSHIDKPLETQLTVAQGKRDPYRVEPLPTPKSELSRVEWFRNWLAKKELPEADATAQIGGRTLDEATDEDWAALKVWMQQFKKAE